MNLILIFLILVAVFCLNESKDPDKIKKFSSKSALNYSNPIYACGDEFMETVCSCKNFRLNCYSTQLSNLNIEIMAENFTVKSADFYKCGINKLEKGQILPGREKEVEIFNFYNNNISSIENRTFDSFIKLTTLRLTDNRLTTIREGILTEKLGITLLELKLDSNKFSGLTAKTFKYMSNLVILNLSNTTCISKEIFSPYLSNLRMLSLGFCNITTLDDDYFVNLINLKELILHHNPIPTVPKAIKFLPRLQKLDLSYTRIPTLDKHSFDYSNKMETLYISGYNLTSINDCAFCNLPNLKKLEIWYSENLTFFHENAFGSITNGLYSKLTDFGISGSNISSISEKLFDRSKADKLYLGTKGYNCDCSMAWLINDLKNPKSIFSKKAQFLTRVFFIKFWLLKDICISPPELKGKKLSEVSGKICNGKLSTFYHPSNSTSISTFNFHWIFLIGIIFGIAILCFIFHKKILKFIYYQNISQHENDDEMTFVSYSNLEEDSASISVY